MKRYVNANTHANATRIASDDNVNLLKQGYRYHKFRKTFAKLYFRNLQLVSKYKCNLKALLTSGISHSDFYSNVINKLRKIIGHKHFQTLIDTALFNFTTTARTW